MRPDAERQRRGGHENQPVLPDPPNDEEKYTYIDRQLPYLAAVMTLGFVAATTSQIWFEVATGWWPFALFTFACVMSFGIALPLSFTGRGFDLERHNERVRGWQPTRYPDVDIFLPICNEPIEVLRNTWTGVLNLVHAYPGSVSANVLDDGASEIAGAVAREFGFNYSVRPNRGVHKKSGNLRFGFANTSSEFFVILDADFVPRADFLAETLPYMDDPKVAIVQTPQFFRTDQPTDLGGARSRSACRRCSIGTSRSPGTASARRFASVRPHSTGALLWSPRAERR